ncbi:ESX secretion-associated protein EspG [Amycolatopsis sp. cg5]|uniref:ESX secretion-associated protein EspG n=1 Tax=Amycolatopsis sp. cg5 TaxID=3238802 RepID=UPI00352699B9
MNTLFGEATVGPQELFSPLAFDFLWEDAHLGELPYPLQVRSHGVTEEERRMLRQRAHGELMSRGLRDSHGRLAPHIEEWLSLLARPNVSVDALHIPEFQHPPVTVLAGTDGRSAVMAVQDARGIRLGPVPADGIISAVLSVLPGCKRGTESSITLPLDEAVRTTPVRVTAGSTERRTSLSDRTTDQRRAYAELSGQPRLRGGQLAANSRDHLGGKQRSRVLGWFDTATGRYLSLSRAGTDGREWVTVSPADQQTLRMRLNEMVASVSDNR